MRDHRPSGCPPIPRRWMAIGMLAWLLAGCAAPNEKHDITTVVGSQTALASQATPTEIQAAVMAFAEKYVSRAADVFDRVHDQSESAEVRRFARQAKLNLGLGALTIACEVNLVAALLDMVAFSRLQQKSFAEHWAPMLPPEHAAAIQAMYDLNEKDAWALADRFLSEAQASQLRELIDDWYRVNPDVRYTSHVRLIEFAAFRRESGPVTHDTSGSVLALLRLDPMASMDPVAREFQESRLMAERAMFFAARVPPMLTWQAQRMTTDLLVMPEVQEVLASTQQLSAAVDRLPKDMEAVVAQTTGRLQAAVAQERDSAIRQTDAAISLQRQALMRDLDAREEQARALLGEVNQTLGVTQELVSSAGETADRTVQAARTGSTDVIDHAFRRAIVLMLVALIGIPVVMIGYRLATARLSAGRQRPTAPPVDLRRS